MDSKVKWTFPRDVCCVPSMYLCAKSITGLLADRVCWV